MHRPRFRRVVAGFLLRELREAASYKAAFALHVGSLLLALSALYYLSRFIGAGQNAAMVPYGASYLGFALIGFILTELQGASIGAFAQRIRWAQVAGTLEAMLATPARPWQILIAAPIGDFVEAFLRVIAYLLLATFVFDLRLHSASLGPALLGSLLAFGSWIGLGFLAAAASMFFRKGEPVRWFVSGLTVLLAGVVYPTAVLPDWLRALGKALPITYALEIDRRALLAGAGMAELSRPLLALALFCLVLLPVGLVAFRMALERARVDGSLTHY